MSFGSQLDKLSDPGAFPRLGVVTKRWGQLLREQPDISVQIRALFDAERLIPLSSVANIRSGVVSRANAYFIVQELPFAEVPKRFRLTRSDYQRVAVVLDGVETPARIERKFLKPIIKGPDALLSPLSIEQSNLRLFDVTLTKEELRSQHCTGALEYLRRGETFAYRVSDDDLKGGIPSKRAQVKIRKPHWYSLHVPERSGPIVVVPEHYGHRYLATLIPADDKSVVIDTLYSIEPHRRQDLPVLHASLNSVLTWYQLELRGRTQHGQGVLKVKIPDFQGLLVVNPRKLSAKVTDDLQRRFAAIANNHIENSFAALADIERNEFDTALLASANFTEPSKARENFERELRAAFGERDERRLSVAETRNERRKVRGSANVDAFATRVAASIEPFPDPRSFVPQGTPSSKIPVLSKVEGTLKIGTELFNQGEVYAADVCVAKAPDVVTAQYVRGVLLQDSELTEISVPDRVSIVGVVENWDAAIKSWRQRFEESFKKVTRDISDDRTKNAIYYRALVLLHAE